MKITNLLSVVGMLIILSSCTNNQEKIQNKWWVEQEKNRMSNSDIIYFSQNGDLLEIGVYENKTYAISGDKLEVSNRDLNISTITDTTLTLVNGNDSMKFFIAEKRDFMVGKWKGVLNDRIVDLYIEYFNTDGGWAYKEEVEEDWQELRIGDNNIGVFNINYTTFFRKDYEYSISEDKNIIKLKNEDNSVKLYRSSYIDFLYEKELLTAEMIEIVKKDSLQNIVSNIDYSLNKLLQQNIKSYEGLIELFGANYVINKIDSIYYGEGEYLEVEYLSILYPNSADVVTFKWKNKDLSNLKEIIVNNEYSSWHYDKIKIGLPLKELEQINTKPFLFYGFDMDGLDVGAISDFQGGVLDTKKIRIKFKHVSELSGIGYDAILSSSDIAQNTNLIIESILLINE